MSEEKKTELYHKLTKEIDYAVERFSEKDKKHLWLIMLTCWSNVKDWLWINKEEDEGDGWPEEDCWTDLPDDEVRYYFFEISPDFPFFKEDFEEAFGSNAYVNTIKCGSRYFMTIKCPVKYWEKIKEVRSAFEDLHVEKGYRLGEEEYHMLFRIDHYLEDYKDECLKNNKNDVEWCYTLYDYILSKIQEKLRPEHLSNQPNELTQLVISMLDAKEGTVFNPYAGTCYYGTRLNDKVDYCGEENDKCAYALGKLNLLVHDCKKATCVINKEKLSPYDYKMKSYDYIISTLPCIKDKHEAIYFRESIKSARRKAIGIYPLSVCDDRNFATYQNYIESVILLPRISAFSNLNGEDNIIIVVNKENTKKGTIRFVDARSCCSIKQHECMLDEEAVLSLYRQENAGDNVADVSIEEINRNNCCLLPTLYTSPWIPTPKNGEEPFALGDLVEPMLSRDIDNGTIGIGDLSINYLNCDIQVDKSINASSKDLKTICLLAGFYGNKFKVGKLKGILSAPTTDFAPQVIPFVLKSDKVSEDFLLRSIMLPETEGQAKDILLRGTKPGYSDTNIYFRDFCKLKIVVPSRDEQDRLCKEDVRRSLSKADSDKAKAFEDFRKDLHMKKHAIGQTIFNVRNWWDLLQHAREENHGQLADDAVVGRTNKISVSEIFANLGDAIDDLQQQISHLDRGNGLARSEFYLVEFIEDYIKHHKSPMFEYVYDGDRNCSHQDFPGNVFEEHDMGDGHIIRKVDYWQSVTFSEEALKMVFDNIISNACSHGFEGREAAKNRVLITISMEGTSYVIYISNNGKPLDPQLTADDVFAYSCSTKRGKGHYGLGGYEVKNLMREFGGDADVISTPEEEYTVTYKLIFNDTNIIG